MITLDFCPATPCAGHDCPNRQAQLDREQTLALACFVEPELAHTPEQVERLLRRALELSRPTTSTGVAHQMPDAPFQIHMVASDDRGTVYEAVYCGDEAVDELLERAPLYAEAEA